MSANPHSFAHRLQSLRAQRRLSKTALGKLVGVSTTCIWNWEEGNTKPRAENMFSLSKALNVNADMLEYGGDDTRHGDNSPLDPPLTLPEVIASAKMQIANLAGIDPSNVKISLDY